MTHATYHPLQDARAEEVAQRLATWYELQSDLSLYVIGQTDKTIYDEKVWRVQMAADALFEAMRRWEAEG